MQCPHCKIENPTGRSICYSCDMALTPTTTGDIMAIGALGLTSAIGRGITDPIVSLVYLAIRRHQLADAKHSGAESFRKIVEQVTADFEEAERELYQGNFQEALRLLQRASVGVEFSPNYRAVYYWLLGNAYFGLENYSNARTQFLQLLPVADVLDGFPIDKAYQYLMVGDATFKEWEAREGPYNDPVLVEAIKTYTKVLVRYPENPMVLARYGYALYAAQRYGEAVKEFTRCIHYDPTEPYYYYQRGLCYSKLRQADQAVYDLQKAHKLDPNNLTFNVALAKAYMQL